MNVVLVEPEIPPNTGNVARLCAATQTTLHLIEPLGFELSDRMLKRAGMDYWKQVDWKCWPHFQALREAFPARNFYFIETGTAQVYSDISFQSDDVIVFGRETKGLPLPLIEANRDRCYHIPMLNPESRSLNLANCVSIVLYEALRQQGFQKI
ncbi:MAG: tRNA (cytidine(34)-2'-O)-methyltransferase [Verrucomicrobiota bacterium]